MSNIARGFIAVTWITAAVWGGALAGPGAHPASVQTLVAVTGQHISNVTLTSTSGPCVLISGVTDVWIDGSQIGPCAGNGVLVTNSARIRITNSTIHTEHGGEAGFDTGNGISIRDSADVLVQGNQIWNNENNVYAFRSPFVRIIGNYSLNPLGPKPGGHHFTLTEGSDGGLISDNFGEQTPRFRGPVGDGKFISDGIDIFQTSNVRVERNYLRDGDDELGCGIVIGDNNGSGAPGNNHTVVANTLIRTNNCGIGVAGGSGHTVENNKIFDTNFEGGSGNVGLYVWDWQNLGTCSNITVRNNVISNLLTFQSGNLPPGSYWDYWNPGNCSNVTFTGNILGAAARDLLTPLDVKLPPPPIPPVPYTGPSAGRISGTVTSFGGVPLQGVTIQTFSAVNRLLGTVATDSSGNYSTDVLTDGTYFIRTANGLGYIDEVYDDMSCGLSCSPLSGTPITIAGVADQAGKNFVLQPGGFINGVVRNAATTNPLQGVTVAAYAPNGLLVAAAATDLNGAFLVSGLPSGTYYLRTENLLGYKDKIFNNLSFCAPSCLVTDGSPVIVTAGNTTGSLDFDLSAGTEFIQNGNFSNGVASWQLFANLPNGAPDNGQIVWQIANGTLEYYRKPTSASGVFLQNTGVAVASGQGLLAQFDFANTSDVRQRISVLIHDSDFLDLSVCTFWAPPNSGSRRYAVLTHTTKTWANATISFYAASADTNGGFYQIDNVSLQAVPSLTQRTDCVDPKRPGIASGSDGPELLANRDFGTGDTSQWTTFGTLTSQVVGGVFEFVRPSGTGPAGVILQSAGAGSAGQIYGAGFDLGNSSNVRKRVTVLLHDFFFADLTACTFWLEPNTPLARYGIQSYATQSWFKATISIYAASVGTEQWMRLDNVSLKKTPGAITAGTECFEPGSIPPNLNSVASFSQLRRGHTP